MCIRDSPLPPRILFTQSQSSNAITQNLHFITEEPFTPVEISIVSSSYTYNPAFTLGHPRTDAAQLQNTSLHVPKYKKGGQNKVWPVSVTKASRFFFFFLNHQTSWSLSFSGQFSEDVLHEWMPFVIFRARSRERSLCRFRADFWVGVASRCVTNNGSWT